MCICRRSDNMTTPYFTKFEKAAYVFRSTPKILYSNSNFNRLDRFSRNENGCTMTSTAMASAMDGSIQFGGNTMHDRRVARGSNFASLRFNAPTTENVLSRQAEARRRAAVRQRAQIRARKLRSRTPPPLDGRKHGEMQTDKYLEELTDREVNTFAVGCQADLFPIDNDEDDRFTSSVSSMTTPRIDAQTQLDENDLIFPSQSILDYDEVQGNNVIASTVNKILREAILEINAEIEKFQTTKEIISTRAEESGTGKDHTIIFTRHELCSLLKNFNAQNEHSDWPILDFEETNYNQLVDAVFHHLRMILTNLDFLANITQKQLEFREIKSREKLASPPSSPPENLEVTRSIKTPNETIPDNNTSIKDEETNNPTAVHEVEESTAQENETESRPATDSQASPKDRKEILEKSSSINATQITSNLMETDSLSKSSTDMDEKYSTEVTVNKVDETLATSTEISSMDPLSKNAETAISEPVRNTNQDSSDIRDEKEFDKTEIETSELQLSNPQSTDEDITSNTKSAEGNDHVENKLVDPSAEKTEHEDSTKTNVDNEDNVNNGTRSTDSEIQQKQISSDSLNAEEIRDGKNKQNISDNLKSLPDQDNEVKSNETSETVSTAEHLENGSNVNDTDAVQDSKLETESDLNDTEMQMSKSELESSEEQHEKTEAIVDSKFEEKLQLPTESKQEIQNTENEQQPDQMQPIKPDEKNSAVNYETTISSSEISKDVVTEKEPSDVNIKIETPSDSIEKTQGEISANELAIKTTEAKNSEEGKSLQELSETKIEVVTASKTKIETNVAEERPSSLHSTDSPIVPEITVEHSETDHLNKTGTETEYRNQESEKISEDSNTNVSKNTPTNGEVGEKTDSEISRSDLHSVNENITSITNLDNNTQDIQVVQEKQVEPSTTVKED